MKVVVNLNLKVKMNKSRSRNMTITRQVIKRKKMIEMFNLMNSPQIILEMNHQKKMILGNWKKRKKIQI